MQEYLATKNLTQADGPSQKIKISPEIYYRFLRQWYDEPVGERYTWYIVDNHRTLCVNQHMTSSNYQDLEVWKKSINLVTKISQLTKKLPKEEIYVLSAQIRRAAISIPSNIAEGQGKKSRKDFVRFLNISYGSLTEIETQLILIHKLYHLEIEPLLNELTIIKKMLNSLINKLSTMY